jgi:hypothetical protein
LPQIERVKFFFIRKNLFLLLRLQLRILDYGSRLKGEFTSLPARAKNSLKYEDFEELEVKYEHDFVYKQLLNEKISHEFIKEIMVNKYYLK